ncbi:MAG: UDP-3-O-[3-hydroxymyristoyl] N-acetylglucosamine deacetylase, partial [Silicimonas sp.]|nr:UDP-3-O-[3-hydroxymyristoyl] N-acetylglucosamine deacetylase [Silicimonas sp.]
MQTTIKSSVSFTGIGLHTGRAVRMTIHPASAEYGIWFRRTDIDDNRDTLIAARWDRVTDTQLNTRIE